MNLNLESLFTTLTCMNSLRSYINTFGRYRKVKPINELGTLLIFDLLTLHFEKYLNLSHSTKCSVSTQLTCIQKLQYNKVSISTTRTGFEVTENNLSTLKTDNFAKFMIFAILDFLDFLGILPLWCFTTFGTSLQIL